jgi:peptidoglycan hydrolase CwlO-like protein
LELSNDAAQVLGSLMGSNLKFQISDSKSEISNLKSEVSNPKSEISNLRSEVSNPKSEISNVKFETPDSPPTADEAELEWT